MRELKFRAWDKNKNRYEPRYLLAIDEVGDLWRIDSTDAIDLTSEKDRYIIEQFTGLTDKNDKEIYEGDALGGDWLECYIAWCDKCKQFQVFSVFDCMACSGDVHWCEIAEYDGKLEVIGNIHEDPELLGKEEK